MTVQTSLSGIAQQLEAFAAKEWEVIKADGAKIVQELEPVVSDAFSILVNQFGQIAVQIITGLMVSADTAVQGLSGTEKHNLSVTTLVDKAATQGVTMLAADASALIKNSYLAVAGVALPSTQ